MKAEKISNALFNTLKEYGAIKWHKSKHGSFYIKFRDVRLGSIRIADHKGRDRYSYTYEIFTDEEDCIKKSSIILNSIVNKSFEIKDFDPNVFIVYSSKQNGYIKLDTFQEYKNHILKKDMK